MMDDGKVSVAIRAIENGYMVSRSWCEKKEDKEGHEMNDYKSEEYYLASLPPVVAKMFSKGNNAQDMGGKNGEQDDEYQKASRKMKKKEKPDTEPESDMEDMMDEGEEE